MDNQIIVGVPTNLNDVYIRVFEASCLRYSPEEGEKRAKEAVKYMREQNGAVKP